MIKREYIYRQLNQIQTCSLLNTMKFTAALISFSLVALATASVVKRDVVPLAQECYDNYGCFSDESPWSSLIRPFAGNPNPPWAVGTRFLLFTRTNQYEDFEIVPDNELILADSPYDKTKKTLFLIHGFTESHLEEWMIKARNALLEKEDINIISVDWSRGAARNYLRATNNIRMVGAQLIRMLNFLVEKAELDLASVRIVGHSIGAHAASYAGEHFWGAIGHITALDPTDPYFGGADPLVRIDKSDAAHVQVIHTNGDYLGGMGIRTAIGHVDIYVNGGNVQPGCHDLLGGIIGAIINIIGWEFDEPFGPLVCSHNRAAEYYVESITSTCPFVAHKCSSEDDYNDGHCHTDCSIPGYCTVLGYSANADDFSSARGTFYLNTDKDKAFCQQSVHFDTNAHYQQDTTEGELVGEIGYPGKFVKFTVTDGEITSGQILSKWVGVSSKIIKEPNEQPTLKLKYTKGFWEERYLKLDAITVSILNEKLELERVHYRSVQLDSGVETTLYPQ